MNKLTTELIRKLLYLIDK